MNLLANSRAYVALLAALPRLGITVAEGQSVAQAIEARLNAASAATPPAPSAEQIQTGVVTALVTAGIPVAAGQTPAAAIAAFAAEFDSGETDLATAQASVVNLTAQLAAANARADLFATSLAKHGIKPVAKDAKAGITAADIDAAIEARVSTKAGEFVASTGAPRVENVPAAGAASEAAKPKSGLTGLARTQAAYAKKYPGVDAKAAASV